MNENYKQAITFFRNLILDRLPSICWVGGGCVRDFFSIGYMSSDIDVYFPNEEELLKAREWLEDNQIDIKFENEKIVMFYMNNQKFEFVKVYFDSPMATIQEFDFTVCCCAVSKEDVFIHETFFMDLAKRRLVINKLPFPLSTLQRLQKYFKKGYWICNGGLLDIARAIAKLDFENPSENHLQFYSDGKPRFIRFD